VCVCCSLADNSLQELITSRPGYFREVGSKIALLPANAPRNRYKDILPCESLSLSLSLSRARVCVCVCLCVCVCVCVCVCCRIFLSTIAANALSDDDNRVRLQAENDYINGSPVRFDGGDFHLDYIATQGPKDVRSIAWS
jgi:protein tyrosine phosphatase